jgi:hypothetical protein
MGRPSPGINAGEDFPFGQFLEKEHLSVRLREFFHQSLSSLISRHQKHGTECIVPVEI